MPLFVGSQQELRKLARATNDLGLLNQGYAYQMFQGCAPIWMYPYNWNNIESGS